MKNWTVYESEKQAPISLETVSAARAKVVEIPNPKGFRIRILVLGIGGAGCNIANYMNDHFDLNVDYAVVNTDAQVLEHSSCKPRLVIAADENSYGLGAGNDPEIGIAAAERHRDELSGLMEGYNMVFVIAGMGGGTGTGATPVIADIARELGVLSIAIITMPFVYERRGAAAADGLQKVQIQSDATLVMYNQKLLDHRTELMPDLVMPSMSEAHAICNRYLGETISGVTDILTRVGIVNADFADVSRVIKNSGRAILGTGRGQGPNRIRDAVNQVIGSPLLAGAEFDRANRALVNAIGRVSPADMEEIERLLSGYIGDDAMLIPGTVEDTEIGDELIVTIMLADIQFAEQSPATEPQPASAPPGPGLLQRLNVADFYTRCLVEQ